MKYNIINGAIVIDGNPILNEINIDISEGKHIGIIGRNGSGKTTLLKTLIDNNMLSEGIGTESFQIKKITNFKIGYQEQIEFNNEDKTLEEELELSFKEIKKIEKRLEKLSKEMNKNKELISEYTNLLDRYSNLGGYTYKKEYEVVLSKFGFKSDDKFKKISSFSGGERTKIAFIKLLLSKPDLLLLDEPTNHLDIEALEWLEKFLKNYKKAFVIVSHDRMFLNNVVDIIYDISSGKTNKYQGNYDYYEKEHKIRYEQYLKSYEKQKNEINRLYNIYEKFRSKPTKAKMALSRLKMIERMQLLSKPEKINSYSFKTNINNIDQSAKKVLTCKDLVIGYNNNEIAKINLELIRGHKLAVIGSNGTGKSTLLQTINGIIAPLSGEISYGLHVKSAYFDQNLKMIDENNTVLQEFRASHPNVIENDCRKELALFQFYGEDVYKKINVLSGGEKVRLQLCKLFYDRPNLLLLDEPTNHMDIIGKEHLEDILMQYPGTIIFVSHDRYFINKIATELLIFKNDSIEYLPYGYDKYLENKQKEEKEINPIITKKKKIQKNININEKKENLYELKKNLNKLEKQMVDLEVKKKMIENELSINDTYNNLAEVNKLTEVLKKINNELLEYNLSWEEITNKIIENDK